MLDNNEGFKSVSKLVNHLSYTDSRDAKWSVQVDVLLNNCKQNISALSLLVVVFLFVWFDSLRPINNLSVI